MTEGIYYCLKQDYPYQNIVWACPYHGLLAEKYRGKQLLLFCAEYTLYGQRYWFSIALPVDVIEAGPIFFDNLILRAFTLELEAKRARFVNTR